MTLKHNWIKITQTPISILSDDQGDPVVFVDPDEAEIAEDMAVYGCSICNEPMRSHHDTICTGEANE